jgi:hypothetical protein
MIRSSLMRFPTSDNHTPPFVICCAPIKKCGKKLSWIGDLVVATLAIKAIPAIAASLVSHAFHQVSLLRAELFKSFRKFGKV